jgi:hypothetical protein
MHCSGPPYYYTFTQWQGKRTGPRQTLAMHAAKPRRGFDLAASVARRADPLCSVSEKTRRGELTK